MSELTITKEPTAQKTQPANPFYSASGMLPPKPGAAQEVLTLDEGQVTLQWPAELSKASAEEFEYWVKGLLRRARHKAGIEDKGKQDDDSAK